MIITNEAYPWSFLTQIFLSGYSDHGDDRKVFEVTAST